MKRNIGNLTAVLAAAALVGGAQAGGPRGGGHAHAPGPGQGGRQATSRGFVSGGAKSNGAVGRHNPGGAKQLRSYRGRDQRHWSYSRWSGRYGCWLYYCQADGCYFYWCAPDSCYYPVDYCPYGSYDAGDTANYAPRWVPVANDDN